MAFLLGYKEKQRNLYSLVQFQSSRNIFFYHHIYIHQVVSFTNISYGMFLQQKLWVEKQESVRSIYLDLSWKVHILNFVVEMSYYIRSWINIYKVVRYMRVIAKNSCVVGGYCHNFSDFSHSFSGFVGSFLHCWFCLKESCMLMFWLWLYKNKLKMAKSTEPNWELIFYEYI